MAAVWQSATETEVYAWSLLLASVTILAAHRGQERPSYRRLTAFLFGLAVPLHLSALVAGPAAVALLATGADGRLSWRAALAPAGAWLAAVGLGTASLVPLAPALALCGLAVVLGGGSRGRRSIDAASLLLLVALGASAVLIMLVRARHDPGVNQGNPAGWSALLEVVARRQYDVPPLWPRRAPLWLQLGNVVQYADWQVASALDSWPGGSWRRTPWTLAALALAWVGARSHLAADRRSGRAAGILMAAASLGVVAVLNLRAGPSFGHGIVPPGAVHEARERDYFFSLGFALWGLWAGYGLATLAAGSDRRRNALLAGCLVPAALNWRAVDRRARPDALLAPLLGSTLAESAPANAVVLAAGDNDSYSLWFAIHVRGQRRDLTTIVLPLLGADWYREELGRRHGLLGEEHVANWLGRDATVAAIAESARRLGRPFAATVAVPAADRSPAGGDWVLQGMVHRLRAAGEGSVDTALTRAVANRIAAALGDAPPARDATGRYIQSLLGCPALVMALEREGGAGAPVTSRRRDASRICSYEPR